MEIKITVLWHITDEFYNIRIPKGTSTISQSVNRMRGKIYAAEGVKWNYHVVLSMSNETVEGCNFKINSKMLNNYFKKTKEVFGDCKHFWKYEQGRKSERPHFHLLMEIKEKDFDDKELEKLLETKDIYSFVENQRKYEINQKKSDKEIIMGYLMYKFWQEKGIVYARHIKNEWDLAMQVEKDIAKRTGSELFEKGKRKYGFSQGIKMRPRKKGEYEWVGNCPIYEARDLLESTKENFVKSFTEKSYDGEIVFERTVEDLDKYEKSVKVESKDLRDKTVQETFDIDKLLGKIKEVKEAIRK